MIHHLYTTISKQKSSPDILPLPLWSPIHHVLVPLLAKRYNEVLTAQAVPPSYSGSVLIPIHKQRGALTEPGGYRPVQLLTTEAKLLSKACLNLLAQRITIAHDQNQFATGLSAGTIAPQLILSATAAMAAARKWSSTVVFMDLTAAFDSVIHQLLFPAATTDASILLSLATAGVPEQQAREVLGCIRTAPLNLAIQELPAPLQSFLQNWTAAAWFQTPATPVASHQHHFNPATISQPALTSSQFMSGFRSEPAGCNQQYTQGIRQGDALSSLLFCFYMRLVMAPVAEYSTILASHITLPLSRYRTLSHDHLTSPATITHLTYSDDVALPLAHKHGARVLRDTQLLTDFTINTFRQYNLTVNLKPGKTAACMRITSSDARALWQHIKDSSITANPDTHEQFTHCLLYTSDAADDTPC
eukprot:2427249-Amphidinium_carterae.1